MYLYGFSFNDDVDTSGFLHSSKTEERCLLLTVTAITNGFVAAPFYES